MSAVVRSGATVLYDGYCVDEGAVIDPEPPVAIPRKYRDDPAKKSYMKTKSSFKHTSAWGKWVYRVGKTSSSLLAGVKAGRVHFSRVAGNTVWSHMASDVRWEPINSYTLLYPLPLQGGPKSNPQYSTVPPKRPNFIPIRFETTEP